MVVVLNKDLEQMLEELKIAQDVHGHNGNKEAAQSVEILINKYKQKL